MKFDKREFSPSFLQTYEYPEFTLSGPNIFPLFFIIFLKLVKYKFIFKNVLQLSFPNPLKKNIIKLIKLYNLLT